MILLPERPRNHDRGDPRHRLAATLGLDGLERPPAQEDGVEPRHHAREVDRGVHDDPVGLAVRPGQIPVEAHSDGIDDLSHQSLLSPLPPNDQDKLPGRLQ